MLGEFANRKDLPEAWAGRADAELAEVTGVPDARFCHAGRFMAVAGSREARWSWRVRRSRTWTRVRTAQ